MRLGLGEHFQNVRNDFITDAGLGLLSGAADVRSDGNAGDVGREPRFWWVPQRKRPARAPAILPLSKAASRAASSIRAPPGSVDQISAVFHLGQRFRIN